jgi:hypothetical protein
VLCAKRTSFGQLVEGEAVAAAGALDDEAEPGEEAHDALHCGFGVADAFSDGGVGNGDVAACGAVCGGCPLPRG